MNTNPDETTLALWLEDELNGAELAAVEVWAADRPDQLAARGEVRKWRGMIAAAVPAAEEPPYPDFFNTRILQGIRETVPGAPPVRAGSTPFWKAWLMPLAACAGMALAFWTGTQSRHPAGAAVAAVPPPVAPVVYTPEKGVNAEWFASSPASATVIVLNGVAAIPDATDFTKTVYFPTDSESDRTAALDSAAIDLLTP